MPQPDSIWPPSCFTSHGFSSASPMRMAVRPRAAKPASAGVANVEMEPIICLDENERDEADL